MDVHGPPVNEVVLFISRHPVCHVEDCAVEVAVEKLAIELIASREVLLVRKAEVDLVHANRQ